MGFHGDAIGLHGVPLGSGGSKGSWGSGVFMGYEVSGFSEVSIVYGVPVGSSGTMGIQM